MVHQSYSTQLLMFVLIYTQDMVLLHHEVEIEFPGSPLTENHRATLLEFGKTVNGKTTSAMALTVGIPAAAGALVIVFHFCSLILYNPSKCP